MSEFGKALAGIWWFYVEIHLYAILFYKGTVCALSLCSEVMADQYMLNQSNVCLRKKNLERDIDRERQRVIIF